MDIMTNFQGTELDDALIALDEPLISLGRYIHRAPLDGNNFSIKAKDHIYEEILRIYDCLRVLCYDTSYIVDERDTLLNALEYLNPMEFQNLFIICKKFWQEATYLPLGPSLKGRKTLDKTAVP